MITYTARDLVKRARQLADLENSDFISWNEQINLLNENYVALYQKLCNIGDKAFTKQIHIGNGETELPADFYQLKNVALWNNGNVIPVLRRAETQSYNDRYYEIKNGVIYIGGYSGDYVVDYFPEPETLVFKPESVAISEEIVTQNTVVAAYDKKLLFKNRNIYDLETQSVIGAFGNSGVDISSDKLILVDDRFIVTQQNLTDYLLNKTTGLNPSAQSYNSTGYLTNAFIVVDGKICHYRYNTTTKLVSVYPVDGYTADNANLIGTFTCDCPVTPCVIWTNSDFSDVWYFDNTNNALYHGSESLDGGLDTFANVYLVNGELIIKPSCTGNNLRVFSSDNELKMVSVKGTISAINKFDFDTGYGYTVKRYNKYYIDSFLEDTVLNFPNTFYYNILSYYLAIAFKLKQGGDVTGLSSLLAQQEMTFFDTLNNDDCGPVRISNVY